MRVSNRAIYNGGDGRRSSISRENCNLMQMTTLRHQYSLLQSKDSDCGCVHGAKVREFPLSQKRPSLLFLASHRQRFSLCHMRRVYKNNYSSALNQRSSSLVLWTLRVDAGLEGGKRNAALTTRAHDQKRRPTRLTSRRRRRVDQAPAPFAIRRVPFRARVPAWRARGASRSTGRLATVNAGDHR